jgi:hypothetical protein
MQEEVLTLDGQDETAENDTCVEKKCKQGTPFLHGIDQHTDV